MRIKDDLTPCDSDIRLDDKVVLVTGATAGSGAVVAELLAARGARVIITGRSAARVEATRSYISNVTGNYDVVGRTVDYESLASIRNFAQEMYLQEPTLNILINNVGAIGLADRLTADNLHVMMQVNYFGAFLLTFLLYPLLKLSAPSRIINVSSLAIILGEINFDHLNAMGKYSSFGLYSNAKLADTLFAVELAKRTGGSGVSVYSMDPGLMKTDFFRNYEATPTIRLLRRALIKFGAPVERAATAYVFLASDPQVVNSSGQHFLYCKQFYSSWLADDPDLTRTLWYESKKLVRLTRDEDWEVDKESCN